MREIVIETSDSGNENSFEARAISLNAIEEAEEIPFRIVSEPYSYASPQYRPATSLATEPKTHFSRGCENFCSTCTEKFLPQPLEASFHFCCEGNEKSKRKRSLSLRVSRGGSPTSCCSGSPTRSENRCNSPIEIVRSPSFEQRNSNDVLKRMRIDSPVFEESTENRNCIRSFNDDFDNGRSNESFHEQSDGSSADNDDELEEQKISDHRFVGMAATISAHDLLEEQRRLPNDVTRNLENRWLKSHFQKEILNQNGGETRRKMKCSNDEISPPSAATQNASANNLLNDDVEYAFSIVHFNDVYEICERNEEPVAGAARFAYLVKEKIAEAERRYGERPLVVFSGDCLNPSTLSCATKGRHMVEVLNELGVDVAVFGNHEFDFGVDHAVKCVENMNSTWLLANVVDKLTERRLAEGIPTKMVTRKNGLKIGFIGLVEEEWLDTLATVESGNLIFEDYVEVAQRLAKELKEQGAAFVIALTHMRWPNDKRLARSVPDVDLILGGHDHDYDVKVVDECLVIKSGSDFRTFSTVDLHKWRGGCIDVKLTRYDITRANASRDPPVQDIVERFMSRLEKSLQKRIGSIQTNLNGIFSDIRQRETTLGNFVADILATVTKADLVLINSGTFRSGAVHQSGDFLLHDLMTILPINDTLVTIEVTGQQLLDALENGVSRYPSLEGRFPQLSAASFGFDPDAEPGNRVIKDTIRIRGKPLDTKRTYKMVTKAYVARGRDGYTCLASCKLLNDPDSGPLLSTVVRNHISNVNRLIEFEKSKKCKVSVSSNGRILTADRSDVAQAFDVDDEEEPVQILQKIMQGAMKNKDSCDENNNLSNNEMPPKTVHLPNFIAISKDLSETAAIETCDQKLVKLRRASLSTDELNALKERKKSPDEIRWQISPLIEARIFHCKDFSQQ